MTDTAPSSAAAKRVLRRVLRPVFRRIDDARRELIETRERADRLAAQVEQLARQVERLEAYQHVTRTSFERDLRAMVEQLHVELAAEDDLEPATAMRLAFENVKLHAEAIGLETRERLAGEIADLRGTARLTQALAERAANRLPPSAPDLVEAAPGPAPSPASPGVSTQPAWRHVTPSFDLLYRSFENRHRGAPERIAEMQRDDYLELLLALPSPDLPVVDLGCGRGELVEVLGAHGVAAIGVDSNLGQVVERVGDGGDRDDERTDFVEADLFDWLDEREDESCRAVVSLHVVEHLPLDLQVRLVFEARRVLAPGGLLVLETPNTLSLSTAASNFWVDPTHERPVHPSFLEFLADESGFRSVEVRPLHPVPAQFPGAEGAEDLVEALDSLILGCGDAALVAQR